MDRSEYSDEEEDESPPDAYWRRRVITLALGLGLFGILAWGFSGGGAKTQPSSSSSLLPATALGTAVPGPSSSTSSTPSRSATPTATAATPSPSASVSPTPSPSASKTPDSPHPSARPGVSASFGASAQNQLGPGGQCPAGSVVLSLFTDRQSYTQGQYPQFQVYAVSPYAGS